MLNIVMWSNPTYVNYEFPTYIHVIGWIIALTTLLSPPIYGAWLYYVTPTPGSWKEVRSHSNINFVITLTKSLFYDVILSVDTLKDDY